MKWQEASELRAGGIYLTRHRSDPIGNSWLSWVTMNGGSNTPARYWGNSPPRQQDFNFGADLRKQTTLLFFGPIPT